MRSYEIKPAGITDIGNVRAVNEDQLLVEGKLFAVADGMGGLGRGEIASRVAVERLQSAFQADQTTTGLVDAVRQANAAVRNRARSESEPSTGDESAQQGVTAAMGTTIAAVALVDDGDDGEPRLAVVNVGDSRVYLLRDGQLTRLSSDHSLVADLVRAGSITEEQAGVHPERHVLTRALGIDDEVEPHVSHADPASGDRLLLCSDGLFNELPQADIAAVLQTVSEPEEAAGQLVATANDRGGSDNITAVVLDIA